VTRMAADAKFFRFVSELFFVAVMSHASII
jgi:hypothetical protein